MLHLLSISRVHHAPAIPLEWAELFGRLAGFFEWTSCSERLQGRSFLCLHRRRNQLVLCRGLRLEVEIINNSSLLQSGVGLGGASSVSTGGGVQPFSRVTLRDATCSQPVESISRDLPLFLQQQLVHFLGATLPILSRISALRPKESLMLLWRGAILKARLSTTSATRSVIRVIIIDVASSRTKGMQSVYRVVVAFLATLKASARRTDSFCLVLLGDWRFDTHMILAIVLIARGLGDLSRPWSNEWALQRRILQRNLPRS